MKPKNDISRITIDIPTKDHKRLKAMAAILGKSMRELVIESIENQLKDTRAFNKKTLEIIKGVEEGKDLVEAKNKQDLFEKLGI